MTVINDADLDSDAWCTTEDVRDEVQLEIGNSEPDFEKRIKQATRRVRSDYADVTGDTDAQMPDGPPDELLEDATAYLAASMVHLAFATNISGENQGDQRHVFLEDMYEDTFESWVQQADLDAEGEGDDSDVSAVEGRRGSLTDDIF